MEVYIEYVIFDNFVMNYLILFFTKFTVKSKIRKLNMIVSTLFGVVSAVLMPLITINFLLLIPIKLCVGVIMVLILKKYENFRQFAIHFLLFITYTFVFGGFCYAIINLFNMSTTASGIMICGFEMPMGLIMILMAFYVYFLSKIIAYTRHHNENSSLYFDVTIKNDNKNYYLRGFVDSGNKLYDTESNKPIVVISFKTFCRLFSKAPIENYFLNKPEKLGLTDAHYINVDNVVGGGKMLVFKVDEIKIQHDKLIKKNNDYLVGISNKNFSSDFECLLHSEVLRGEK